MMSNVKFNTVETVATIAGKEYNAEIGTVIKTFLGTEPDHAMFSALVEFSFVGGNQSTGYIMLTKWDKELDTSVVNPAGLAFLKEVMETIGGSWESLLQKKVWILRDKDDRWGRIVGLVRVDDHQKAVIFNESLGFGELDV